MDDDEKIKKDARDSISLKQREGIYDNYLMPLKAKISQILLYDSERALNFLQEYQDIIKDGENIEINDIINKIVELEFKIEQYEKERGQMKLSNEQVNTILKIIDDLLEKEGKIETEELEQEFKKVKEIYEKINKKTSFSEKDIIETKIFLLQAQVLIRKARDGAIDLYNDISKEDVAGLTFIINEKINELMQDESEEVQDRINKVKVEMIDREDFVYDPEVWKMLDKRTNQSKSKTKYKITIITKRTTKSNIYSSSSNAKTTVFNFQV